MIHVRYMYVVHVTAYVYSLVWAASLSVDGLVGPR